MLVAREHYFPRLIWPFPAPSALALSSFSSALSGLFLLSLSGSSPSRRLRPPRACRFGPAVPSHQFSFRLSDAGLRRKPRRICTYKIGDLTGFRINTCTKIGEGRGHALRDSQRLAAAAVSLQASLAATPPNRAVP